MGSGGDGLPFGVCFRDGVKIGEGGAAFFRGRGLRLGRIVLRIYIRRLFRLFGRQFPLRKAYYPGGGNARSGGLAAAGFLFSGRGSVLCFCGGRGFRRFLHGFLINGGVRGGGESDSLPSGVFFPGRRAFRGRFPAAAADDDVNAFAFFPRAPGEQALPDFFDFVLGKQVSGGLGRDAEFLYKSKQFLGLFV
jgi:hypothetical protein